jgi:hypothetical protein
MTVIPIFAVLISPEAITIAGKLELAHTKMSSAAVFLSDGITSTLPTKVEFSPKACRLWMPNQQIAEAKPTEIRFYDEIFNQATILKVPKGQKIPDAGAKVAIVQQEPITWLLNSTQRRIFFADLKRDKRWKVIGSSLKLLEPKRNTLSEVFFDNSFRITEIKLRIGSKTLSDWKYRYVGAGAVPTIPSSAKNVAGLPPRPTIPPKTDGKSVLFSYKLWRSMSRLEGRKITQILDEGTYNLTFGKGQLTETGPNGSWTMVNKQLLINPKKGSPKTVNGGTDKFLEVLKSKGIYASPISRYLMNRKIPFLDLFDHTDEVKLVEGLGKIDGKNLSVLSIKRGNLRIRMYADPSNGDLAMMSTDNPDGKGHMTSGSRLKIKYQ